MAVIVALLVSGYWAISKYRSMSAVRSIRRAGGTVEFVRHGPEFVRRLLSGQWTEILDEPETVVIRKRSLTRAELLNLGTLRHVRHLKIESGDAQADFALFPRLQKLESLHIYAARIDDAFLQRLADLRLPNLRSLSIEIANITDAGIRRLCDVYDLEILNLYGCSKVTPSSVEHIARMHRLRDLGVGGSGIAPRFQPTPAVTQLQNLLPGCTIDFGD